MDLLMAVLRQHTNMNYDILSECPPNDSKDKQVGNMHFLLFFIWLSLINYRVKFKLISLSGM